MSDLPSSLFGSGEGDELPGWPLPEGRLHGGASWNPATVEFWDDLRRSPSMKDADSVLWRYALDTALIHHVLWSTNRWEHAGELRQRMVTLGLLPGARMGRPPKAKEEGAQKTKEEIAAERKAQRDAKKAAAVGAVDELAARRKRLGGASG